MQFRGCASVATAQEIRQLHDAAWKEGCSEARGSREGVWLGQHTLEVRTVGTKVTVDFDQMTSQGQEDLGVRKA